MLSDREIRECLSNGAVVIDPVPEDHRIQPASIDLTLGHELIRYKSYSMGVAVADPDRGGFNVEAEAEKLDMLKQTEPEYMLMPWQFVLATTKEWVALDSTVAARVEGRSSLGRIGLMVHVTAGFIDPGFNGHVTLELMNLSPIAIRLRPGMGICQLSFDFLTSPALRPYGHPELKSKYQGQKGVTAPRFNKENA